MSFDLDAFEERAAIIEYDGGLTRFRAETLAAQAQGVARHDAIRIRNSQAARDLGSQAKRDGSNDLPGVQPAPEEKARRVSLGFVPAGWCGLALSSLFLVNGWAV